MEARVTASVRGLVPALSLGAALILAGSAVSQPAPPSAAPTPAPPPAAPAPAPAPVQAAPPPKPANALPSASAPVVVKKDAPSKAPTPVTRARSDVAILQALDKVTAETIRFEAPVGQPVRYKTLVFTVRACETTAPDEPVQDFAAYLTVDSQPVPVPGRGVPPARQMFRGWMFASSPGLNPLQHPIYDAWVIACKAAAPPAPAARR
jgi:hypothetical protein